MKAPLLPSSMHDEPSARVRGSQHVRRGVFAVWFASALFAAGTTGGTGLLASACSDDATSTATEDQDASRADGSTTMTDGATSLDATTSADATPSDAGADTSKPSGPARLYVGSEDGKIRVFAFDPTSYALTPIDTIAAPPTPSFLALDPTRRFLYAVGEGTSQVSSFAIDPATGKLTSLANAVSSGGNGPAHISLDEKGSFVLVANYGGGTVAVFPRAADGRLGAPSDTKSFGGAANTHQIITSPGNAFVLIPNKGRDDVAVFRLSATGTLTDAGAYAGGNGARHIVFDATGKFTYVIDELGSAVTAFAFDPATGSLSKIQTISSLPPDFTGANTGAEIAVTVDGRHVIASNRGHDSLAIFDIGADHKLTRTKNVLTGGKSPRHFSLDDTGRFLFVANQASGSVVVMTLDATTGIPTAVGSPLAVPSPSFAGIFR